MGSGEISGSRESCGYRIFCFLKNKIKLIIVIRSGS